MIGPRRLASSSSVRPIALFGITVVVLYFARQVFIPLAIALTLTFLLAPLVSALQKCRLRRVPAVIIVVLFTGVAAGAVGWTLIGQLLNVVTELPEVQRKYP